MHCDNESICRRGFISAAGSVLALGMLGGQGAGNGRALAAEAKSAMKTAIDPGSEPFGEVSHIGWVVKDLHRTVDYWQGIGLGEVSTQESHEMENLLYRGKKIDASVRWGWATFGSVGVELFEPKKGRTAYDEFLERHGEGVQHVAFAQTSCELLEERLARLRKLGVGILQRGTFRNGAGEYVYLDTTHTGGVCFELVYDPNYSGSSLREAPDGNKYPFGEIIQYATVVAEIDPVFDYYKKLGFQMRDIDRDNKGLLRRYRAEEEDLRMHMGWGKFGDTTLEMLQPTRGRSIYKDYLATFGDGFHHIAFTVDDMDRAVAAMRERGVRVSQDGAWGKQEVEGRFAYLETDLIGGLAIELLWSA